MTLKVLAKDACFVHWLQCLNLTFLDSDTPHGHGILPCHVLPHSLASCSQEHHLPLLALIHTPQPGKVFPDKMFIKLWKKILPYGFSLSKTIERRFSLENLIIVLLKVYGLKQPRTSKLEHWTWNQHMWPWIQSLSLSLLKSHYRLTLGFAHYCIWKQYLLQTYCCEKNWKIM